MASSPEAEAIAKHARAVERLRIAHELLGGLMENVIEDDSVRLEVERVHRLLDRAIPEVE